jgi:hypothetical protein
LRRGGWTLSGGASFAETHGRNRFVPSVEIEPAVFPGEKFACLPVADQFFVQEGCKEAVAEGFGPELPFEAAVEERPDQRTDVVDRRSFLLHGALRDWRVLMPGFFNVLQMHVERMHRHADLDQ